MPAATTTTIDSAFTVARREAPNEEVFAGSMLCFMWAAVNDASNPPLRPDQYEVTSERDVTTAAAHWHGQAVSTFQGHMFDPPLAKLAEFTGSDRAVMAFDAVAGKGAFVRALCSAIQATCLAAHLVPGEKESTMIRAAGVRFLALASGAESITVRRGVELLNCSVADVSTMLRACRTERAASAAYHKNALRQATLLQQETPSHGSALMLVDRCINLNVALDQARELMGSIIKSAVGREENVTNWVAAGKEVLVAGVRLLFAECSVSSLVHVAADVGDIEALMGGMKPRALVNSVKVIGPAGMLHSCAECYSIKHASQVCSRCKAAYYCSKSCQTRHWRTSHKIKCGTISDP